MRKLTVVLTAVIFAATCMAQGRGGSRGSAGGGRSWGGGGFSGRQAPSSRSFSGGVAHGAGRSYVGGYSRSYGYRGRVGGSYSGRYYGGVPARSFGSGWYNPWYYAASYYPFYYDYGYDPYVYDPYVYDPYPHSYNGYYAAPLRAPGGVYSRVRPVYVRGPVRAVAPAGVWRRFGPR